MTENTKKNIIIGCWLAFAAPFVIITILILSIVIFADIPSGEEIENPKRVLVTQVLSEDGKVLTTFQSTENRMLVRYDEISPYVSDHLFVTSALLLTQLCDMEHNIYEPVFSSSR